MFTLLCPCEFAVRDSWANEPTKMSIRVNEKIQNLKVKCSVNFSRIVAHKYTQVFSHDKQKSVQGMCFMNERQPNLPEHEDRSG